MAELVGNLEPGLAKRYLTARMETPDESIEEAQSFSGMESGTD